MNIGTWIDECSRPLPDALRGHLTADGPVSLDALLDAAEAELHACAGGASPERTAAFSLLAADAYVTYACLWALTEGAPGDLSRITERITREWAPETTA